MHYPKIISFTFLDKEDKKKQIDSCIIELDDNSDPEDDMDYIPPSPVPDEISSALETRLVLSVYYVSVLARNAIKLSRVIVEL